MLSQSIAALYPLIRPLLFCVDPETTHHVTLSALNPVYRLGAHSDFESHPSQHFFEARWPKNTKNKKIKIKIKIEK